MRRSKKKNRKPAISEKPNGGNANVPKENVITAGGRYLPKN
jgi:hypothetical protein